MNPKDTQEYVTLRAAAMMFLKAEQKYCEAPLNSFKLIACKTRLDAARSVLWDVINDKDLTK